MLKKGFLYLIASIFISGALNATDTNSTITKLEDAKVVISINDNNYTSKDFPLEFNNLSNDKKHSFLIVYSNYKLTLDSLKDEQKSLQKNIDTLIKKRDDRDKRIGIERIELRKVISNLKLTLDTIAYKKVEENHPKIEEEIKKFFEKNKEKYNYPDYIEFSAIKVKDENLSKKIISKINLSQNQDKFKVFIEESKKYRSKNNKGLTYMGSIISKNKKYGKEFFDSLWEADENNILNKAIKKGDLYYIVYIHKKAKSGSSSFDFVKDDIKGYLLRNERIQWIKKRYKDVKKDSKVIIYNNNL
jgi:foldase protein PrsA